MTKEQERKKRYEEKHPQRYKERASRATSEAQKIDRRMTPIPPTAPAQQTITRNSRVMWRNRVQQAPFGMVVEAVDTNSGKVRIDGVWYKTFTVMLYSEWLAQHPETEYK